MFIIIKEFTEICLAYSTSTVETNLETKWKAIETIIFCLLYHYSTYMIQCIQCTGPSGMAWQSYWEQKKPAVSQPVIGKVQMSQNQRMV